ncbi:MAG: hypothetical protein PHQ52_08070 [Candidatus Omnitrophica bacterium]|nr:hypothetical protein [Candidatus Omnitrophota bacterium]
MKKYIQPKIKSVILDPDQAVLHSCMVGGAYIETRANGCFSTGTGAPCTAAAKGEIVSADTRGLTSYDSSPS